MISRSSKPLRVAARSAHSSSTCHGPSPRIRRHLWGSADAYPSMRKNKNRLYTPVLRPDEFWSYHSLAAGTGRPPFLTFWTATYCNTCKTVSPILNDMLTAGLGEDEGGVAFCEVVYDSPDIMTSVLGMDYLITKIPTLLPFARGEPLLDMKVVDPGQMTDREWMRGWIKDVWTKQR